MNEDIKNKVEIWIKSLGYTFNKDLYRSVSKMSYYRPSYKVMADTVLQSIKENNPGININEAWKYTTKFVDGMKSNLIANNNYFQSIFKDGLFNPLTNKQDGKVDFITSSTIIGNDFNYLKNIRISNGKENNTFDFVIVINGFPMILIEVIGKNNTSFKELFLSLEQNFEKYPMFFNFNKLILLTDGFNYKMGSLYDFPEDYISFSDSIDDFLVEDNYKIKYLEEILSKKYILKFLKSNKDSRQIDDYINDKINKDNIYNAFIEKSQTPENNNLKGKHKLKQEDEVEALYIAKEDEELSFLADFFNPDLDELLESEDFKKRLEKTREVPNFKENRAYIEDIQKNENMETLDTFIKANEKLVLKEVNKFIGYQTTSLDYDDLCQLGYIGLLKALDKFDLDMENEFSTYAIYWIRQAIIRGINYESLVIRIPVHRWESLIKLRELERMSIINFDRVDYDWISDELGLKKEKLLEVIKIRNNFMNVKSLDTPVGIDEDTSLGELIADKNQSVEEMILNNDMKNKLEEILETLDDRSKDILIKRFGLNGQDPMTLEEIGAIYDLTRERIRQIESNALKKLRHPTRIKKIQRLL